MMENIGIVVSVVVWLSVWKLFWPHKVETVYGNERGRTS